MQYNNQGRVCVCGAFIVERWRRDKYTQNSPHANYIILEYVADAHYPPTMQKDNDNGGATD